MVIAAVQRRSVQRDYTSFVLIVRGSSSYKCCLTHRLEKDFVPTCDAHGRRLLSLVARPIRNGPFQAQRWIGEELAAAGQLHGRTRTVLSSLERLLNLCIGKLAGFNELIDPTPFILLAPASFPQRLHMLSTLCEQLSPQEPKLQDYRAVVSKLETAQRGRTRFMHNRISHKPKSNKFVLAVGCARGRLKTELEAVKPSMEPPSPKNY